MRFNIDMKYGIMLQDPSSIMKVDCTPPDYDAIFNGIPFICNDLIIQHITKTKKWKRQGRMPKIKTKCLTVPGVVVLGADTRNPKIYAHSEVVERLQRKTK